MSASPVRRRADAPGADAHHACCSTCQSLIAVAPPQPGVSLVELRCPRCGTSDVYHINTIRPMAAVQRGCG